MAQEKESVESTDVRRAFERLQQTLELLSDRYRELRRERKALQSRVDELEQELKQSAKSDVVEGERRRAMELEERVIVAEKRSSDLYNRIADLEHTIGERDALIVEQEDLLNRLREQLGEEKRRQEEIWRQGESMRNEIEPLRAELAEARQKLSTLERSAGDSEELASVRAALADASAAVDRVRLEGEEMASQLRVRLAEKEDELESARQHLERIESERARLQASADAYQLRLTQLESTDDERLKIQRARIEQLTGDLAEALDMAARKEGELLESSRRIESLQEEVAYVRESLEATRSENETLRSGSSTGAFSEEERRQMIEKISGAIEVIDRYLPAEG